MGAPDCKPKPQFYEKNPIECSPGECHKNCETCKGDKETDCTDCNEEENNRELDTKSGKCLCKVGYFD